MRAPLPVFIVSVVAARNGIPGADAIRSTSSEEGQEKGTDAVDMNPIKKVVALLQVMSKKVSEENDAEKNLFEKFMCYCRTGKADLQKSLRENDAKVHAIERRDSGYNEYH
jgi:hypothetical protein